MTPADKILAHLDSLGIAHREMHHDHADFDLLTRVSKDLGALVVKNYFLPPRSRNVFVLCSVRPEARLKTPDISKQAGTSRPSFAENEDLR
ncbi:MAG: hypothetical protein MJ099_01020, partial [Clostridia bacterium]|nr:hypothetical protein [Clostridia bacterium]